MSGSFLVLKRYDCAGNYLRETESFLEENELMNNLLIGISRALDPQEKNPKHHFISVFENGRVVASAIKTSHKALLAYPTEKEAGITCLAQHFKQNDERLRGVIAETNCALLFATNFVTNKAGVRKMIVYGLRRLRSENQTLNTFRLAVREDFNNLMDFFCAYELEAGIYPKRNKDELETYLKRLYDQEAVYVLSFGNEVLCMASKVRTSRQTGIVGYVYTPVELRGRGYASDCVRQLSQHLLASGYNACGLFAEKENAATNKIYLNLGYEALGEFSDLDFVS